MNLARTTMLALAGAALIAPATISAVSASATANSPTASRLRIVLYEGGDSTTKYGPSVLTSQWQLYTKPEKIVTTNDGTLVEDTSLEPAGGCIPFSGDCGEWRYSTSGVELEALYWEKPDGGGKVEVSRLSPLPASSWTYFGWGTGTESPRCLTWTPPSGPAQYIQLTKEGGKWESTTTPCDSAP